MDGPDPSRLALVLSKRPDGSYAFGTGYFVTSELVLTASHAIPHDSMEVSVRIESSGEWHASPPVDGRVVPPWRDDLQDAVLIRVAPGVPPVQPISWLDEFPQTDEMWGSTGYPAASSRVVDKQTDFKTAGLEGKLYSRGGQGQGQRELELTVDNPAKGETWRGISGAPVFVGDKLAGILKEVPADFSGGRLYAVPSHALLAVARFREFIEPQWLTWPSDQPWIMVLNSASNSSDLVARASAALRTFNSEADYLLETGGKKFKEDPVVARIEDALESPGRWLQFVRAMCAAPVMVADVTGFQPGVMLALGVRSVVRRGVTLNMTAEPVDETHLGQLPFNIQETKLSSYGRKFKPDDPDNPITVISRAMRDGFAESRVHSRYLDLPAYDAVRCTVPETAKGLQAARESVLVLCSFHPDHTDNWTALADSLLAFYAPKKPVRMLDLSSPRLVGQALYEYIRWAVTCVVDWTSWRPNVFYEMGVRLACSNIGPMCVIDARQTDSTQDLQKIRLRQFFDPIKYDRDAPADSLNSKFKQHEARVLGKAEPLPVAMLPHDATYRIATDNFDWSKDESTLAPHRLLTRSILESVGRDPQQKGLAPVLFSVAPAFSEQLRSSMRERWIAAWYYLKNRYARDLESNPGLRAELKDIAENALQAIPPDTTDTHLQNLAEELQTFTEE